MSERMTAERRAEIANFVKKYELTPLPLFQEMGELLTELEAVEADLANEQDARTLACHERDSYRGEADAIRAQLVESQVREIKYRDMFEHLKKSCLCDRSTKGFDYGDIHENLGKHPRVGARWATPFESCEVALKIPPPPLADVVRKLVDAHKNIAHQKDMTQLGSCCVNKCCSPVWEGNEKVSNCLYQFGVNRGFAECAGMAAETLEETAEIRKAFNL